MSISNASKKCFHLVSCCNTVPSLPPANVDASIQNAELLAELLETEKGMKWVQGNPEIEFIFIYSIRQIVNVITSLLVFYQLSSSKRRAE